MVAYTQKEASKGFSIVEIGLVVAVIVIIGTVAYLFYQNNIAKKADTAPTSSSQVPAPAGTTARVNQLTQQDAAAESSVDTNADSQAANSATSANSAINNVGGAYNENDL